jgi:L-rhamnose mutarotase
MANGEKPMQRISFVLNVKDGQQDEYIRRHQAVWPEVLDDLQRAGIHNMSIFMHGRQMFLYMEVDNYAEAIRILGDSPKSLRWEEYMAPIMEGEAEAAYDPENAYPDGLPEVFHWESPSEN